MPGRDVVNRTGLVRTNLRAVGLQALAEFNSCVPLQQNLDLQNARCPAKTQCCKYVLSKL